MRDKEWNHARMAELGWWPDAAHLIDPEFAVEIAKEILAQHQLGFPVVASFQHSGSRLPWPDQANDGER